MTSYILLFISSKTKKIIIQTNHIASDNIGENFLEWLQLAAQDTFYSEIICTIVAVLINHFLHNLFHSTSKCNFKTMYLLVKDLLSALHSSCFNAVAASVVVEAITACNVYVNGGPSNRLASDWLVWQCLGVNHNWSGGTCCGLA